jgi:hypothetical protein
MLNGLLLLTLGQSAAILPSAPVKFNTTELGGKSVAIPVPKSKATLLIFTMKDCPIANRMAPNIRRIASEYQSRGVASFLVYIESPLSWKEIAKHHKDFALPIRALMDPKHLLAKQCGASITPQAALLDPSGRVRYLGRINDLYEEHGKAKERPTREDLRIALDQFLGGSEITRPVTQAVGCFFGSS